MIVPIQPHRPMRAAASALIVSLALLLAGCFIAPGKFTSELALGPDQEFTFEYEGEIFFLGLSSLAQMGAANEDFEPQDCYVDGTDDLRDCTANELAGQRAIWESEAQDRAAEAKQQADQMAAMLGGIDPTDPEAADKFAQLLQRQKGWQRVENKGDGLFEVSYRARGKLTHDFMFPVIEGVPATTPFVQVLLRQGDVARVTAPGFSAVDQGNPMAAMMGGMGSLAGIAAMAPDAGDSANTIPKVPVMDGTFTVRTDAAMAIRANNTDEGPIAMADGKVLRWEISPRTKAEPMALVHYGQ